MKKLHINERLYGRHSFLETLTGHLNFPRSQASGDRKDGPHVLYFSPCPNGSGSSLCEKTRGRLEYPGLSSTFVYGRSPYSLCKVFTLVCMCIYIHIRSMLSFAQVSPKKASPNFRFLLGRSEMDHRRAPNQRFCELRFPCGGFYF